MKIYIFFFFIISHVFAQDTLIKRDELFGLESFETSVATFSPIITLKGFRFEKIQLKKDLECKTLKSNDLFFALFFSSKFSLSNDWKILFERCQGILPSRAVNLIMYYSEFKNLNHKGSIAKFNDLMASFRSKTPKNFKSKRNFLQKVETLPNGFLQHLLKAYLAYQWNNKDWAEREVRKILNTDLNKIVFEVDIKDERAGEEYIGHLSFIVDEILKIEKGKGLSGPLVHFINFLSMNNRFDELIKKYGINWSLQEMRILAKDYTLGVKNIGLWFYLLGKRAFRLEVLNYLGEYFNDSYFKRDLDQYGWLLQYYRPTDPQFRERYIAEILKAHKKNGLYSQNLKIRLLQVDDFKKKLIQTEPEYTKPLFIQKRGFYNQMVKEGKSLDFAVYQLHLLGERGLKVFRNY